MITNSLALKTGLSLEHRLLVALVASPVSLLQPALRVSCSTLFLIHNQITPHAGVDGGTESLGITAGETENPGKNMPRVVKFVFWRCVSMLERHPTLELTYSSESSFSTSLVSCLLA